MEGLTIHLMNIGRSHFKMRCQAERLVGNFIERQQYFIIALTAELGMDKTNCPDVV